MVNEASAARGCFHIRSVIGVSTSPGATALTRMDFAAYVVAADLTNPSTPLLQAAMASWLESPIEAAAELSKTIDPPF